MAYLFIIFDLSWQSPTKGPVEALTLKAHKNLIHRVAGIWRYDSKINGKIKYSLLVFEQMKEKDCIRIKQEISIFLVKLDENS